MRKIQKHTGNGRRSVFTKIEPYLYILPLFLLLGTFKMYSTVYAIVKSFYQWDGGRISVFVGMQNYIAMFSDKVFGQSMMNLGIIVITSILKVVTIPLIMAEFVMRVKSKKAANFYKYAFIVPMVIPSVVIIMLWRWIYDYNGLLNGILSMIGLERFVTSWLGDAKTALGAVIGYNFPWVAGIQFLIFLSGLQNIPDGIYESVELEGITPLQRLFYIDIPLLAGQFRYLIITTVVTAFQSFEHILLLTNGGPGATTMVPALHLYNQSFSYFNMGYACALGTVLFLMTSFISYINMKYIRTPSASE